MSAREAAFSAAVIAYGNGGYGHVHRMAKAIAAYEAALAAAGLVMVPREPTRKMQQAGENEFWRPSVPNPTDIYRAMIAAAPQEAHDDQN